MSLEDITPQEIGRRVRERLVNEKNLKVRSVQTVSYVKNLLTPESPAPTTDAWEAIQTSANVSSVTVTILAEMTPVSYKVDMYNEGREQPTLRIELSPEPEPTITESHWYESMKDYRVVKYPAPEPTGIGDLKIETTLFKELGGFTCATAEFFFTWSEPVIGEAFDFERLIGQSKVVNSNNTNSQLAFRLLRDGYHDETSIELQSRHDQFLVAQIDHEIWRMIEWRTDYVHVRNGESAGYLVVERSYAYVE